MKQDKPQRRATVQPRRSSAAAILAGKSAGISDNYTTFGWMLLFATFLVVTLISFLFTPYTHQLDEIKNVLLMFAPPFLLLAAVIKMDFSAITWKRHGALILLGLYLGWMWISWLLNPYKPMGEQTIWFNYGVATFTVVFAWFMNTENKIRKTMIFFVTLGFVSTILGLYLYAGRFTGDFYQNMLRDPYWQTPDRSRWATLFYTLFTSHGDMYSFILNSDFYAAFLVMIIPISISMFLLEEHIGLKVYALTSLLLMNVCLALTNSNDSFIAMGICYAIFFVVLLSGRLTSQQFSTTFKWTLFGCISALIILIGIMMLPKIAATLNFKSEAFEGRRVLWGGGFWPWIYGDNLFGESIDPISIIFGTGPGGYRHYFPWFRRPDFFDQQINNVTTFGHNFYLDTLLETGLVGLVLLVGFHVRVFADGIRQIRTTQSRVHMIYQIGILIGVLGIAIQNYSSPNNRWAVAGMIYWCMFGLSMGLASVDNPAVSGENSDSKLAGIPVYKISRWACIGIAAIFFLRCVAPGAQFLNYWKAAKLNADGLRAMESVYAGMPQEQQQLLLESARQKFREAITRNPTFATSYYKLGHIYNQLGMSDTAIDTYENLDKINANYSEVHLNLGIMYAQKAGSVAQNIQAMEEKAQGILQEMQSASGARKSTLDAEYGTLMEQIKTKTANIDKEQIALMEKSYSRMKEAAHQSLKPNTQYLTGSIGRELVSLYEQAGQQEKADKLRNEIKKYFRSLLEYEPKLAELQVDQKENYPKAQKQLLTLAQETGNEDEVIEVLKRMVADNPDSEVMLNALLESYDRAGKTKDKLNYLEQAVHADPTDPTLHMALAEAYKMSGDTKKYINELRRVEVLSPQSVPLLKEIYTAYSESGNQDAVKIYAEKLTSAGVSLDTLTTPAASQTTVTVPTEATFKPIATSPTTVPATQTTGSDSISTPTR